MKALMFRTVFTVVLLLQLPHLALIITTGNRIPDNFWVDDPTSLTEMLGAILAFAGFMAWILLFMAAIGACLFMIFREYDE